MAVKSTGRRRGRPSAGEANPVDSRRRLLDAAARVFAEHGYRGATVDAILERAGLSKGAFYWHFASKEELFETLLRERIDQPIQDRIEQLRAVPADTDLGPRASRDFLEVHGAERETVLLEQEYRALAARDAEVRARYARRQRDLRDALAAELDARAEKLGAPDFEVPSEEVATAYLALARGLASERLIDPRAVPDHLFGEIASLIYDGLVARAARPR